LLFYLGESDRCKHWSWAKKKCNLLFKVRTEFAI
jgi:hypothetical protein